MEMPDLTYGQFLDTIPEASIVFGRDGTIMLANAQANILLGYSPGELHEQSIQILAPETRREVFAKAIEAFWDSLETRATGKREKLSARRKDGLEFPVDIILRPVEIGGVPSAICLVQDITQQRRTETELRQKNRAHATLSACNQLLVRATDEAELLNEICRICVEIGGYRMAWVSYAEHDAQKSVRPVAQKGFEQGYLESANITWADAERGRGPTGTAIRTRQICIARDIPGDPTYAPWLAAAIQHNYAASIALPLIVADKVLGALNIYSSEADAFDMDEAELLKELAADIAFGVETLHTRHARAQAEEALRESEERYHLISTVASDYMFSTRVDPDGKLSPNWATGALETITGFTLEEYIAGGGMASHTASRRPGHG
jgi:PAS domain S-box-containing protein